MSIKLTEMYKNSFNFNKNISKTLLNKLHRKINKSIEKYWCNNCNCFHKRFFRNKLSYIFFNHLLYKSTFSNTDIWKKQFKKSWNNYSIKKHQKIYKSKKQ